MTAIKDAYDDVVSYMCTSVFCRSNLFESSTVINEQAIYILFLMQLNTTCRHL